MKRDILDELARKVISLEEAERIFNSVLDAGQMGLGEGVGMSRIEYTAHGHGVWFDELASWRKSGWPKNCAVCKQPLDPGKFGWMATHADAEGHHLLIHVPCMPPSVPSRD